MEKKCLKRFLAYILACAMVMSSVAVSNRTVFASDPVTDTGAGYFENDEIETVDGEEASLYEEENRIAKVNGGDENSSEFESVLDESESSELESALDESESSELEIVSDESVSMELESVSDTETVAELEDVTNALEELSSLEETSNLEEPSGLENSSTLETISTEESKPTADEKDKTININDAGIKIETANMIAKPKEQQYKVAVTYTYAYTENGKTETKQQELTQGIHYKVFFAKGSNGLTAGEQQLIVKGTDKDTDLGRFTGTSRPISYKLLEKTADRKKDISKMKEIALDQSAIKDITYTGNYMTPKVNGLENLDEASYKIVYKNNVNTGKASVTVIGQGDYYGTKELTFAIKPTNISKREMKLEATNLEIASGEKEYTATAKNDKLDALTYKGKAILLDGLCVKLKLGENSFVTLEPYKDYTIAYKKNAQTGKATATIKGVNNFAGTIRVSYEIVTDDMKVSHVELEKLTDVPAEYTPKGPRVAQLTVNGITLKSGADFRADYKNCEAFAKASTGTILVTGAGSYRNKFKNVPVKIKVASGKFHIKENTVVDTAKIRGDNKKIISVGKVTDAGGVRIKEDAVASVTVTGNNKITIVPSDTANFETTTLDCHVAKKLTSVAKQKKLVSSLNKKFDGVYKVTLTTKEIAEKYLDIASGNQLNADDITIVSYKNNHKLGVATVTIQAVDSSAYYGTMNVKFKIVTEPKQRLTSTSGEDTMDTKILVVYFSCTNTTKTLAEYVADALNADIEEIVPKEPYTEADLAYYTNCRADKEQKDPNARPAISGSIENMTQYDTIILGYPIWHGQAPRIISTFLESYDFAGKTIVPFCTSHSSGIGSSDKNLHKLCDTSVIWKDGKRFGAGATREEMEAWLEELGIEPVKPKDNDAVGVFNFETQKVLLNSGYQMPIYGLGTYSLLDDVCVRSVSEALSRGVRLIDTAHMYHNEAEVGEAVRNSGIPREEIFVITKLYPNQYADAETAIEQALEKLDIGYIDLMLLHHPGTNDVKAYKAMEQAVADGKIRSIGLSNWYIAELEEFLPQVSIPPALVQNEIHPYYQDSAVVEYIQKQGIVVQAWYPLGGRGHQSELLNDKTLAKIANAHGKSTAQVILRWDLQNGVVVIPGSSNPDHIQENTELFDFSLSDEEMEQIQNLNRDEKHDWY